MTQDKPAQNTGAAVAARKKKRKGPDQMILDYLPRSGSAEETLFMINEILYSGEHESTRKHVRAPISIAVAFKVGETTYNSTSYTLSQRGAFIKSPDPPPEGTKVEIELSLPDGGEPIHTKGEVVQSSSLDEAKEKANISGMSVIFKRIKQEDRRRIDKLVRAQARKIKKRKK